MTSLADDDRVVIRILRRDNEFNSFPTIKEFPNRGFNRSALNRLIKTIDATGTSNPKPRERIRTARKPANIARVSESICSKDDDSGTIISSTIISSTVHFMDDNLTN